MRALVVSVILASVWVVHVQERSNEMRKTADSLQAEFKIQWKRSDSMRVSSILLRMRADSLRREATAVDTMQKNDSVWKADSLRENALRSLYDAAIVSMRRKNAAVLTASDSITAAIMATEPDSGVASFYANAFHGKKTSNGELYDMNGKSCAHRWLPFGTLVRVRNLSNNKETIVRVNDRGPWKHGRIIDVSKGAAEEIDMIRTGTARVEISVEPKVPVLPEGREP